MLASLCLREMIYHFNFILKGKRKRENKTEYEIFMDFSILFLYILQYFRLEYNK